MFSREIENNKILQWALGALVFAYFIAFDGFIGNSVITITAYENFQHVCPPYFQNCGDFYFLYNLPFGYSQTFLYMMFFALMVWSVYLMSQKKWKEAMYATIPSFIWHVLNILVLTDSQSGNYEYYLMIFGIIILFLPHKEFFLKLSIVSLYVLSTVAKIHPSWIEGGYFTAMRTGLPVFPEWSIPFWTNLVIFMEMIGAWFLMSKNRILQRIAVTFFGIFHIYSGILVEYRYPATVLPMLLIMFGPWYQHTKIPFDKKAIGGWALIVLLFFIQFTPRMIEGDEKLTLEGNKYGLYMFEANHQCMSEGIIHYIDGTERETNRTGVSARDRCNPYTQWFRFNQMCERIATIDRIEWRFDHSINGGPFYRIVDVPDACALEYSAFKHNDWIQLEDTAEIIGYPVKNFYY